MNRIFWIVLITFTMIGITNASNFYITGNLSNQRVAGNISNERDAGNSFAKNISKVINGGNLGVGYNITPWAALETTYNYMGRARGVNIDSIAVSLVVDPVITTIDKMPLKVTGRLGYGRNRIVDNSTTNYDNGLTYGMGLAITVSDNLDVIADYTRREMTCCSTNSISVGFKYQF